MAETLHIAARPRTHESHPAGSARPRVPALRLVRADAASHGERRRLVAELEDAGAGGAALERQARLLARVLDAPMALLSLLDGRQQLVLAQAGLPAGWAGELPPGATPCALAAEAGEALVLEDARRSRRARETRAVRELGARAYAGVPLRAPNGTVVGCACALDTRPREWSGADAEALEGVAAGVEADLARRLAERALADREAIHRGELELARDRAAENEERAGHGGRASGEEVHAGLAGWPATEAELGRAVERDELRLLYQPVVSLRTGRVAGFEAQLRWEHPRLGTLHPAGFLPLAEATGLAVPVGAWALRESCRSLRGWRRAFPGAPVGVSVGLSARELRGGGLVERVRRALEETGNEPGSLRLQVAEGAAAREPEEAAALHALRELGVQLHLDGFGTGCSSLTRLHRLPLDALKVDRSCVCALDRDSAAARLVRSAVPLAHALGLAVVADGVETASALDLLRGLRCEYAQGPHLSPPLDGDGARELLAAGVRW